MRKNNGSPFWLLQHPEVNEPLFGDGEDLTFIQKVKEAQKARMQTVEDYIQLAIQPKPKWLPGFIWNWLLSKIISLQFWNRIKKCQR